MALTFPHRASFATCASLACGLLLAAGAPTPERTAVASPSVALGASSALTLAAPLDESEPPVGELWVQNLSSRPGLQNLALGFYDDAGLTGVPPITLDPFPRSVDLMRLGQLRVSLADGRYAAHMRSSAQPEFPSVAVARNEWPATGAATLYGARQAATELHVPFVVKKLGTPELGTVVHVQNLAVNRRVEAEIELHSLATGARAARFTRTMPWGASIEIDVAGDPALAGLPDDFIGSMRIRALDGGAVAATATTQLAARERAAFSIAATPPEALGTRLLAPRYTNDRAEPRNGGDGPLTSGWIAVLNPGGASTDVSVSFLGHDLPGNACAGQRIVHPNSPQTLPSMASVNFLEGLPSGCVASVEIRSTSQPIAASMLEIRDDLRGAAGYAAIAAAGADLDAHLPLVRHDHDDLSTSLYVMNAGDEALLATLQLTFTTPEGTSQPTRDISLAPGQAARVDAWDIPEMPEGAVGTARFRSSKLDEPVIALAYETSDRDIVDDAAYTSFVEPEGEDRPPAPDPIFHPFYAPLLHHSGVYDLGLIATGTTEAERERIHATLQDQAFFYAKQSGKTVAAFVMPYVIDGVPYQDWLATQMATGFPDLPIRARSWVAGLEYNGVTRFGRSGRLLPPNADAFPNRGDLLADAWQANLVLGDDRPAAIPWLRVGCAPSYRSLAVVEGSADVVMGTELIGWLTAPEQQRQNYNPTIHGRTRIGLPTRGPLYAELGIDCGDDPTVLRTAPEDVDGVIDEADEAADAAAVALAALRVEELGDGANPAKAVGLPAGGQFVVAQPMLDTLSDTEIRDRLRSSSGLVVGLLHLREEIPTPTPTATATNTPEPTASLTPTLPPPSSTPTRTAEPPPTPTDTALPPPSTTPTGTVEPGPTATDTSSPTPTATDDAPEPSETPTPEEPGPSITPPAGSSPTAVPTGSSTPTPDATDPTETPEPPEPTIYLPSLTRNAPLSEEGSEAADVPDARPERPSLVRLGARPALVPSQAVTTTLVVVWKDDGSGGITTTLVAEDGRTEVAPLSVGIAVPVPVETTFPGGGAEPEVWIVVGSKVLCFGQSRNRGCLTIED